MWLNFCSHWCRFRACSMRQLASYMLTVTLPFSSSLCCFGAVVVASLSLLFCVPTSEHRSISQEPVALFQNDGGLFQISTFSFWRRRVPLEEYRSFRTDWVTTPNLAIRAFLCLFLLGDGGAADLDWLISTFFFFRFLQFYQGVATTRSLSWVSLGMPQVWNGQGWSVEAMLSLGCRTPDPCSWVSFLSLKAVYVRWQR